MDAFEQLVAEFLWSEGYWVQTSVRVRLGKDHKVEIGRPTTPDWEIDVVAYHGATNDLIALECKSFFDSTGVSRSELEECEGVSKGRYKLFCEPNLRNVILRQLRLQCVEDGLCPIGSPARLGMVAGKIKKGDEQAIAQLFDKNEWIFREHKWLKERLNHLSANSYRNHVGAVVAKILLRESI